MQENSYPPVINLNASVSLGPLTVKPKTYADWMALAKTLAQLKQKHLRDQMHVNFYNGVEV